MLTNDISRQHDADPDHATVHPNDLDTEVTSLRSQPPTWTSTKSFPIVRRVFGLERPVLAEVADERISMSLPTTAYRSQ